MPQITYFFGAGASAQVLPVIKKLPERIKFVRDFIEKKYVYEANDILSRSNFNVNKNEAKAYLLKTLDKLFEYSSSHSTIDTCAKKLYITHAYQEVEELIFALSVYFNIEQKRA